MEHLSQTTYLLLTLVGLIHMLSALIIDCLTDRS